MSARPPLGQLPHYQISRAVEAALNEDLGQAGDITTLATVDWSGEPNHLEAAIVARAQGTIAGLQFAETAFRSLDYKARIGILIEDGGEAEPGDVIMRLNAKDRALLSAERVALNFLCHLSGIATITARYVRAVEGTGAQICCTRKTTPGLRAFEKYAVRAGGGQNHRFGLYDAVLIKDNHIVAAGGVANAVQRARTHVGHMVKIEIEVDALDQLTEVLSMDVDVVLLDNMSLGALKEAVSRADGKVITEASGGVTLETVAKIAETGVDLISVGSLTHSPKALDLGLDFFPQIERPGSARP